MGIVLLGPPGSGKGTQGTRLAETLGVRHLSTGDVLRAEVAEGTELGDRVAPYLESGELVPDDLLLAVVEHALAEAGAAGGYVLDGFPRTAAQVEHLPVDDLAIYLQLPDDVARTRLMARSEGRVDDDDPEIVDRRLAVYHELTAPVLDIYRRRGRLVTVNGDQPPEDVATAVGAAVAAADDR